MWYCGKIRKNLTIAQIEIKTGNFLIISEKRLTGLIGKILHRYLRLDRPNHCKHVIVDSFGERLDNGTYTGAIKLLKEQKVDWFGRTEPYLQPILIEDFFELSHGSFEDGFYVGQVFKPKINEDTSDCLKMFDIELNLILFAILAFLFALFVTYTILPKPNSIKKMELISRNLLDLDSSLTQTTNPISILILFYTIYFFIFKNILCNNIKTNQVVVDTSDLVMDKQDLENTKRTICYWKDHFEHKIISTALNGSYLNKIFNKSKNKCFYSSDPQSFLEQKINFDDSLLFLNLQNLVGVGSWLSNLPQIQNRFFFTTKEPLFKVLASHVFRKNVDPYFTKVSFLETEVGLENKINEEIVSKFISTYEYRIRLFRTKNSYVDEFTVADNLGMEYFHDFFQIYIFINLIIFSIYLIILNLRKCSKFYLIFKKIIFYPNSLLFTLIGLFFNFGNFILR